MTWRPQNSIIDGDGTNDLQSEKLFHWRRNSAQQSEPAFGLGIIQSQDVLMLVQTIIIAVFNP